MDCNTSCVMLSCHSLMNRGKAGKAQATFERNGGGMATVGSAIRRKVGA